MGYQMLWAIVDKLTKVAHFISRKSTYSMKEVVRLYGVPVSTSLPIITVIRLPLACHHLKLCIVRVAGLLFAGVRLVSESWWGTELVQMTNESMQKIRDRMLTAQSRQKRYADVRHNDLEFEAGDKMFLNVAPMKGVLRFGRKGKLSSHVVGPFEVLKRIGHVAYRLAFVLSLTAVHNVFHVSMLRKYVIDPFHVVYFEPLQLNENLSYEEKPIQILAREVKTLCNREVTLVKVLW
ncbi:uncharacterized protein LOC120084655 [Benincasa hispida]|uniref:uncharacterized protein LOC120084655 n=1 Tax=Benincasa hispida TaxID=102211 RepID=UPI0018FF39B7|nr:uncharacterized protein LOC120084655 [Benincasa hispida]